MQIAKKLLSTFLLTSLLVACGTDTNKDQTKKDEAGPAMTDSNIEGAENTYAADNLAYLDANKDKEGWQVSPSGLQYKVVNEGSGVTPAPTDFVTVHYEGKLIDGTIFDSSYQRKEPATFPANRLIRGWVEALSMMKAGATWELAIPAELAYGDADRGTIPPHSTLLFKMELLSVKSQEALLEEHKNQQSAYLDENAQKDGVTVTESGLQYKVLESGNGATPTRQDQVKVHYAGRLIDGTEFDSSYRRGESITFGVTQVIPGWTEALMLMKEGDKWEIALPYTIAYGEGGAGANIPPYATLVFDVELIEVLKAE